MPVEIEPCRCVPKNSTISRPAHAVLLLKSPKFSPRRPPQVADMPSKRKERPCDSVPTDRRCRVCCNPRYTMPCEGPLPETSEAEPSRSCSSPDSESTAAVTTWSGRIVLEPTRLAEDADYVEQLGPLRDHHKHLNQGTQPRHQGRPDLHMMRGSRCLHSRSESIVLSPGL